MINKLITIVLWCQGIGKKMQMSGHLIPPLYNNCFHLFEEFLLEVLLFCIYNALHLFKHCVNAIINLSNARPIYVSVASHMMGLVKLRRYVTRSYHDSSNIPTLILVALSVLLCFHTTQFWLITILQSATLTFMSRLKMIVFDAKRVSATYKN